MNMNLRLTLPYTIATGRLKLQAISSAKEQLYTLFTFCRSQPRLVSFFNWEGPDKTRVAKRRINSANTRRFAKHARAA